MRFCVLYARFNGGPLVDCYMEAGADELCIVVEPDPSCEEFIIGCDKERQSLCETFY